MTHSNDSERSPSRQCSAAPNLGLIIPEMFQAISSSGEDGYVPFDATICWISTKGGSLAVELADEAAWKRAVNILLPKIASGKIEVIGRPSGVRSSEQIDRLNFVGIKVINPLHEANDFPYVVLNADPHIVCSFFGDDWAKAGGDKFYQQFVQEPAWTHLQVKKVDLLREMTFQAREELPAIAPSSRSAAQSNLSGRGKMRRAIQEAVKEAFPSGIPPGMSSQLRDEKIRERLQKMEGVVSLPHKRTIERAIRDLKV